jgi:hypothetical protein
VRRHLRHVHSNLNGRKGGLRRAFPPARLTRVGWLAVTTIERDGRAEAHTSEHEPIIARSTSPLRNGCRVACFQPSSTCWNALANAFALFPLPSSFKHLHTHIPPAVVREPGALLLPSPTRGSGALHCL